MRMAGDVENNVLGEYFHWKVANRGEEAGGLRIFLL